ncbi:hypothetical protein HHI36_014475 [Cryptolaemus montrouzieri]|uniref:Uncharacterized protein n=1 Tax=Cryptolaemus montrouzieri TaxID=559131 RepID=A0ABD2N3W9_9CUCU
MKGKDYVSSMLNDQGIRVRRDAKKLGQRCMCKSVGKSRDNLGEETRKEIFNAFWNMNWEPKRNYISNLVKYEEKQRSYVKNESRRKGSFQYRLQTGNNKMKVCKNMFLSTLGLEERSVREWITNPTVHGMPRTRDEKKKTIKQIEDNKKMNIAIHRPKKDQCDLCCSHKVGKLSDEEYNAHIIRKEKARQEKSKDEENAVRGECHVFDMDVQAVKLCSCYK